MCAAVPQRLNFLIAGANFRFIQISEELIHCRHHIRMRIERSARETDVHRPVSVVPAHELRLSTDNADRQAPAEGFSVRDHVGFNVEVFLRAASGETESKEHLIENEDNRAFGAYLTKFLKPSCVGRLIEIRG